MDEPRSKRGPIFKATLAVIAALIAAFLILTALSAVFGFFWGDRNESLGNAGYLMVALFYLILAGPFAAVAFVLGMPLISDNPKWKG